MQSCLLSNARADLSALCCADRGSVYSAGYGALGLGPDVLQAKKPQRIEELEDEGIGRIRAGWGYAAAVRGAFLYPFPRCILVRL